MRKELWMDITGITENISDSITFAFNLGYSGILLGQEQLQISEKFPKGVKILIKVDNKNKDVIKKYIKDHSDRKVITLFGSDGAMLDTEFRANECGIFINVNDKDSMNKAIELSKKYKTIIIQFESVTNIPLELVLAYSQKYENTICKVIQNSDDGWIAMMTMEMGSHAILIKNTDINELKRLKDKVESLENNILKIEELKVMEIKHIGMGDRVCIDTISKLDADEGMILGSTSSGGILVSSENHFLPYMDLRPFRVNAGAVHSYVLCPDNKTKYLSELRAGNEILVVNCEGRVRAVSIGRIKMEKRPMLMIKAKSESGTEVNVIVQDDWHIRILGSKGAAKNSVLLTEGETVLGYIMKEGRHLGVAIDETITEQ